MVARSSAGVVNRVPIAQVADLAELARRCESESRPWSAASEKADQPLTACDFREATAIVVGNEGTGIGPEFLARCDCLARIPIDERRSVRSTPPRPPRCSSSKPSGRAGEL